MDDKKTRIYDAAKLLFQEQGFKETNIAQITKKAGMAVGSFYNYYPSKEKLFMEIFLAENARLKQQCLEVLDLKKSPGEIVKQMVMSNLEGIKNNAILNEWNNKTVFAKIEAAYREENGAQSVHFLYEIFHELVQEWQKQGKIRSDLSSEMIMMLFAAIFTIDTHKEEIGIEYFPDLLVHMTDLLMESLTNCPR